MLYEVITSRDISKGSIFRRADGEPVIVRERLRQRTLRVRRRRQSLYRELVLQFSYSKKNIRKQPSAVSTQDLWDGDLETAGAGKAPAQEP